MPNGGSDCCATCWHNAKNKGEAGYNHVDDTAPDVCMIRDLRLENPFYTYCANHPHRLPKELRVPIGPVYTGDSSGHREVSVEAPDSEEIRFGLLQLLAQIGSEPTTEYPIGLRLEVVVIRQLGKFKEERAVPDLERLVALDPSIEDEFGCSREDTLAAAVMALDNIRGKRTPM